MQKTLFKKIGITFIVIGTILASLLSLNTYEKNKKTVFYNCDQLLDQLSIYYQDSKENLDNKISLYKEDYLNRTYAADFILKNNINMRSNEGLAKIKDLMRVDSINVVDHSGKIVLSSEEIYLGINLLECEEEKSFWGLITSSDPSDNVINLDSTNIIENQSKYFIGIKSSIDDYSIIQIGINRSAFDELKEEISISKMLEKIPTTYENAIFAIDLNNGNILGLTKNNEQELNIDGINSNEEFINSLRSSSEGNILKINGSYKFLKTKIIDDDIILVDFFNASRFINELITQILSLIMIVLFISIVMIFFLKKHFKKYVFNDFEMIEMNIKEIVNGNFNVNFNTKNSEFQSLVTILNDWKDSYKHKTTRMTKIISIIDSNIALFECLHYIKTSFFSDNIKSILGINDLDWTKLNENPKNFESYIKNLLKFSNNNGVIHVNNKYLVIKSYSMDNEFFGIIIDKSTEIKNKEKIANKLKEAKASAEKDNLTDLLNRSGLEKHVKRSLSKQPGEGIMLILDLDNFKQINDKLGHPEGDKVLKLIGSCLKAEFSKDEIIARLGGDEFVIFINYNMPLEKLDDELKRVLDTIRKKLSYYYDNYNVSASIGAAYVDNKINTYEDLYKCADVALYISKQLGKDGYYINIENIRCMRSECEQCTNDCTKRKPLVL